MHYCTRPKLSGMSISACVFLTGKQVTRPWHSASQKYTVISCLLVVLSKLLPQGAVDDLMHYCMRPKAESNRASGRPRYRGVIV